MEDRSDESRERVLRLVIPSLARIAAFHTATDPSPGASRSADHDRLIGSAAVLAVVWARLMRDATRD